jgi:hypothetical protein
MTVKKHRPRKNAPAKRRQNMSPANQPRTESPAPRSLWSAHKRLWELLIACGVVLGLVASIAGLWGPFWPTEPIFSPGCPSNSSPFDVPFTVSNKSIIFPINDMTITCIIDNVKFTVFSKNGSISEYNNINTEVLIGNYIKANDFSSYTCPLFKIITIKPDPILKYAQIDFLSEYDSPWPWRKRTQSKSGPWTLDTSTSPPQWTHGTPLQ